MIPEGLAIHGVTSASDDKCGDEKEAGKYIVENPGQMILLSSDKAPFYESLRTWKRKLHDRMGFAASLVLWIMLLWRSGA